VRPSPFRVNRHDREILRLAVPALGDLMAEPLYLLADTAIIGHIGTAELAGTAIAASLLSTAFAFFIVLAYGTTAAVARAVGRGDERGAADHAVAALWLAVGVGVAVAAVGILLAVPLVHVIGADDATAPSAVTFLRISMVGGPAMLIFYVCTGFLRGHQDTRTPFVVALSTNAANLALEVVLVFGFGWGVAGSAWSTVVCQWAGAAVLVLLIAPHIRRSGAPALPCREDLRRVVTTSGALVVRTAALRAALLASTAVAAAIGTVELAAYQIGFGVLSFLALMLDAIAIAGQALVGRLLGEGDRPAARASSVRMLELGLLAGVALGVALAVLAVPVAGLFTDDSAVAEAAVFGLWFVAAMQPMNAVVFVLDGVLIGAGDHRFLAYAGLVTNVAVFIPAVVSVLPLGLGLAGLWGAIVLLEAARAVANGARFAGRRWERVGSLRGA